jgi:ubiquinone/menaquinone biosynthesis C-methylase UbiE
LANGYVNAWYIDQAQIDKNGDGVFTISLYFHPQNLFYIGLLISGMTFVACVGYLAYDWKFRKNKRDIEKNKVPLDWDVCRNKVSHLDLTENSRILDIGSKDGKKAHYVINKGQLIMSDITSRKSNSLFVLSDATSLPFRNDSFDLVTIFHVIEHIKNDKTVLKEIYRILKKNGTVLIVTPNANRFAKIYSFVLKIVKRRPYRYPLNPDHVFEYGASGIENIMKNSEFQSYKIEPIFMRISRFLRIRKYCDQWIVTAKK